MQAMSATKETLAERGTRVRGVAKAVCCECLCETFEVYIFADRTYAVGCSQCPALWTSIGEGSGVLACVSETVAEGRDESSHVVPAAKIKAR